MEKVTKITEDVKRKLETFKKDVATWMKETFAMVASEYRRWDPAGPIAFIRQASIEDEKSPEGESPVATFIVVVGSSTVASELTKTLEKTCSSHDLLARRPLESGESVFGLPSSEPGMLIIDPIGKGDLDN